MEPDVINWVDKQCKSVEWYTPQNILSPIKELFGGTIPLDPATSSRNPTGATRFYTIEENGLIFPWNVPWFVNPPYGKVFPVWCKKIGESGGDAMGVALLPCGARFSTRYFQNYILGSPYLTCVCWIKGRVKFLREDGVPAPQNPYDSALYGFGVDPKEFSARFTPLGKVWKLG